MFRKCPRAILCVYLNDLNLGFCVRKCFWLLFFNFILNFSPNGVSYNICMQSFFSWLKCMDFFSIELSCSECWASFELLCAS